MRKRRARSGKRRVSLGNRSGSLVGDLRLDLVDFLPTGLGVSFLQKKQKTRIRVGLESHFSGVVAQVLGRQS